jgi:hypothetical protein
MIWHILGNDVNVAMPAYQIENLVVFNLRHTELTHSCRIINRHLSGNSRALTVSGRVPFDEFDATLNKTHARLQLEARALPSSGLCCVIVLAEAGMTPNVRAMNLLPGLRRCAGAGPRKPMPAYFHNWLAERRLVMPLLGDMNWPQFILEPLRVGDRVNGNPYALLSALLACTRGRSAFSVRILSMLERINPECWLKYSDGVDCAKFDSLFYLPRNRSASPNWWLFENAAAASMHQIQHQLAWAQQVIFFAAKASSAKNKLICSDVL